MTIDEAIRQLKLDKGLYETENCHSGDGTPDGDLILAIDLATEALREKAERENIIRDIKADVKPDDTYSAALVLELLGDDLEHIADDGKTTPCFPGQGAYRK